MIITKKFCVQLEIILFIFLRVSKFVSCQDVNVRVRQGNVIGLKIFPEDSSKMPIYAYYGIPYAESTSGRNRFQPPIPIGSWNRTYARDFKSICPQLETFEDNSESRYKKYSENCLFLNIWTPERAMRIKPVPVLVVISGEENGDFSSFRISGQDLAAEGIVVVTIQYRTNVFGWLSLNNEYGRGNLGLMDQRLAFKFIEENIQQFGGDVNSITLLGHGPMGAYNVIYHLLSPETKKLFSRAILMSGTIYPPNSVKDDASEDFIKLLTCDSLSDEILLKCLQEKSVEEIIRAYESIIRDESRSKKSFGPTPDDNYLQTHEDSKAFQHHFDLPFRMITEYNYTIDVPMMIGITSNEAAFVDDVILNYAKQGYRKLKNYIDAVILPTLLKRSHFEGFNKRQIKDTIDWHYFQQSPKTTSHLFASLIKIQTELEFELPLLKTVELLTTPLERNEDQVISSDQNISTTPFQTYLKKSYGTMGKLLNVEDMDEYQLTIDRNIFVYVFHHSNAMDMRGNVNYFGGSQHSSDLPFLFGPSLFKQISRRHLTQTERNLCNKFHQLFGDFIKTGNPKPNHPIDAWHPYNRDTKYIKILGTKIDDLLHNRILKDSSFEENRNNIDKMMNTEDEKRTLAATPNSDHNYRFSNPYHLSNVNNGFEENSNRLSRNFDTSLPTSSKNEEYYFYLKRIYSFWYEFLPSLNKNYDNQNGKTSDKLSEGSPKYKHAFFSMLTLVCMLLAILVVCVYILKRNANNGLSSATSIL